MPISPYIERSWSGSESQRREYPPCHAGNSAPIKASYHIEVATRCMIRKVDDLQWTPFITRRDLTFNSVEPADDHNGYLVTFRSGDWLIRVPKVDAVLRTFMRAAPTPHRRYYKPL